MKWFKTKKEKEYESRYICSDEEFVFGKEADNYPQALKLAYAQERCAVVQESLQLILKTVNPKIFFSRYDIAIRETKIALRLSKGDWREKELRKLLDDFLDGKEQFFSAFFIRCASAGRLELAKNEIVAHREEIPAESYRMFLQLLAQNR